ncbi:MAG: FprA family A-type flavoprotein [Clostridiales bacterium]|nr:FprA family A-type flavoprotein [Clostridiales bacterium]
MHCTRQITDDLIWVGGNDKKLSMFEGYYPVPDGMSYNSYVLLDEHTALFDCASESISNTFAENVVRALNGRTLDYLIIHHMEPDHSADAADILSIYPDVKIVCTSKASAMLTQFLSREIPNEIIEVGDNDVLTLGSHTLHFMTAPMVHWPEVMMSYDDKDEILFSADAFGTFGTLDGAVTDVEDLNIDEYRRYYTNIVGKYGTQVKAVLAKASKLKIRMICPLHGPMLKNQIGKIIEKYTAWAAYESEEKGTVLAYATIYGNTGNASEILALKLREKGVKVKMYDTSVTHSSYILSDIFKYSNVVLASPTCNSAIFVTMENLISEMTAHNVQNKSISVIENGSWAPVAGKLMRAKFEKSKNITFIGDTITVKSALNKESLSKLEALADEIANSIT